jgi:hypothetical protein
MTITGLPKFTLNSYRELLTRLLDAGYLFTDILQFAKGTRKTCFLRHDVDAHLYGIDKIAEIESDLGISSTYYILITSSYNVHLKENAEQLNRLIALGHKLGLHYDLTVYPVNDEKATLDRLQFEIGVVESLTNCKINTIVMHQPHVGTHDVFKYSNVFCNPHNEQIFTNVKYISDSCRAWRDREILNCINGVDDNNLHLNLHPEVWLGTENDRHDFVEGTLRTNMDFYSDSFRKEIDAIYANFEKNVLHGNSTN